MIVPSGLWYGCCGDVSFPLGSLGKWLLLQGSGVVVVVVSHLLLVCWHVLLVVPMFGLGGVMWLSLPVSFIVAIIWYCFVTIPFSVSPSQGSLFVQTPLVWVLFDSISLGLSSFVLLVCVLLCSWVGD